MSNAHSISEPPSDTVNAVNDADHSKLRDDLMKFVKQLFDNSTDDLEGRIEILENNVESLDLNFDVLQDEVIEIQTELVDVGNQLIG